MSGGDGNEGCQLYTIVRKKGAPPKTRGAWVAGLIADDCLRHAGGKGKATALATELVSVLLSRRVEVNELYRFRKTVDQRDVQTLAQEIACEYEHWLIQNSVRINETYSITRGAQEYPSWRMRHKPLAVMLQAFPGEQLALIVLQRIPAVLWEPVWGPEYA